MVNLHIREMTETDIPRVSELLRDCFRWLGDREHLTARQLAFLVDDRSSEQTVREESKSRPHLVACTETGIVGMAAVHGNEIARLYVDPRYHRQGVGKALFEACEAMIRRAGHEEMTVAALVDGALAFYQTMGMSITGRVVYEPEIFLGREVTLLAKKVASAPMP
ncbi:MAG TPA: GNAT family N-acetyltransferase [Phycisphaerae bacterium]|nr:GNAT family N-acetyltransferase [Phycisphaerae bacterium]HRR86093.1 GNAT family N-acetyltransferase [Phycisphaerae bacterium]